MFDKNAPQDPMSEMKRLMEQFKQEDSVMRIKMNDERLMQLAEYDATEGFMNINVSPDTLQENFLKLKGLVKRGSFTLKALEDDVFSKWGVDEGPRNEKKAEQDSGTQTSAITGFTPDSLIVADIPENSPENH